MRQAAFLLLLPGMDQFQKVITIIIATLYFGACTPTAGGLKVSSTQVSQNSSGVVSNNVHGTNSSSGLSCQDSSQSGWIYDPNTENGNQIAEGSGSFLDRLRDLVSVSLSPDSLGEVSGVYGDTTGVNLQLSVDFDTNGNPVNSGASLFLEINDSFVGQMGQDGNAIEAYQIYLEGVKSGHYDKASKHVQITFADQYGEISLDGKLQGETFEGTVSFNNYVSYDNSALKSGVLGAFILPACTVTE